MDTVDSKNELGKRTTSRPAFLVQPMMRRRALYTTYDEVLALENSRRPLHSHRLVFSGHSAHARRVAHLRRIGTPGIGISHPPENPVIRQAHERSILQKGLNSAIMHACPLL